jgi:hypothetical protein
MVREIPFRIFFVGLLIFGCSNIGCSNIGCSNNGEPKVAVVPVTGKLLTAEGKPAVGASVAFHADGHGPYAFTPFGTVQADGTFTLTSYATGDGAPPGVYAVVVVWRSLTPDGEAMGPDRLRGKGYNAQETTPLKATVGPSWTTLEPFRLK